MRVTFVRSLCLFFTVLSVSSTAAEKWIRATSEHFELYTPQSERKARETILYFEQVRDFFQSMMNAKPDNTTPVRIVLFGSEKQYQPYRLNEVAAAFYNQAYDRDYIVMGGYSTEADRIATHEYSHLLMRHLGLRPPLWLNEGLAEFYSTLRPMGKQMLVGDLIRSHMMILNQEKWMPLTALLGVGHNSKEYNTKSGAAVLYSEAWALVHMLNLSEGYRGKGNGALSKIDGDVDAQEMLEKGYGKKLWDIELDLRNYIRNNDRFVASLFPFKWEKSRETVEVADVAGDELAGMLALLHVNAMRWDKAKQAIEAGAQQYPSSVYLEEARGYLAWYHNDWQNATKHLVKATTMTPNPHPKLLYDAARVQQWGGKPTPEMASLLERAMKARPDWHEPRVSLAEHYIYANEPQKVIDTLAGIRGVHPRIAPRVFRAIGYAETMLDRLEQGRQSLERAKQYSKTGFDKDQNQRLADFIDRRVKFKETKLQVAELMKRSVQQEERPDDFDQEPRAPLRRTPLPGGPAADNPPRGEVRDPRLVEAAGKLTNLACTGDQAVLSITTAQGPLRVAITEPKMVTIQGAGNAVEVEFVCGPQSKGVRVEYLPGEDKKFGTQGAVRVLEFLE